MRRCSNDSCPYGLPAYCQDPEKYKPDHPTGPLGEGMCLNCIDDERKVIKFFELEYGSGFLWLGY